MSICENFYVALIVMLAPSALLRSVEDYTNIMVASNKSSYLHEGTKEIGEDGWMRAYMHPLL